jgi:hypothetical protein
MKFPHFRTFCDLILLMIFISPIGAQNLSSTFIIDDEGWTTINGSNLSWKDRGGNPGGFILGEDSDNMSTWYYISPRSWSGNWTRYIGNNLSFDMRLINHGSGYNDNFDDMIILNGVNNSSLSWPGLFASWPVEPTASWTHYEIALLASNFGVNESEFLRILDNVTCIRIRGEYSNKGDIEGLDNVFIAGIADLNSTKGHGHANAADMGFSHRCVDVTSGFAERDGSGEGKSSSSILGNTIRLYCEDNVWGTHSASARVWDEFVYDESDQMSRIILEARIKGTMTLVSPPIRIQGPGIFDDLFKPIVSPEGSLDLNVYMILRDCTDGIDIDKKLLFEKTSNDAAFFDEAIDESVSGYIDAMLIKGHTYQVILEGSASSSAQGISGTILDFSSPGLSYGIAWNYDEIEWIQNNFRLSI